MLSLLRNWGNTGFCYPGPSSPIKQGNASCLWSNGETQTLPANTRLFTLRLKATGYLVTQHGFSVAIHQPRVNITMKKTSKFSLSPLRKEKPRSMVPAAQVAAAVVVMISQSLHQPLVTPPNVQLCIPIKVDNFINIDGAQSKIKWDPTVLTLVQPLKYDALPGNFIIGQT